MHFTSKKTMLIIATILTLIGATGAALYMSNTDNLASAEKTTAAKPAFEFDADKNPGWWTSGNLHAADGLTDDYIGDPAELPAVDMIIHQGENRSDTTGDCFVSYSYFNRSIDPDSERKRMEQSIIAQSKTLALSEIDTKTLDMQTSSGLKDYQLHRYDLTGEHGEPIKRGIEFGTVKVDDGYISIRGNCSTADQLNSTLPILNTTKLVSSTADE